LKNIYLISATEFEILPTLQFLDANFKKESFFEYKKGGISIFPIVSGIGAMMTALAISRTPKIADATLLINAGVAGSFSEKIPIGTVVEVTWDRFADLGVEDAEGNFIDVHEMDLISADKYPFDGGWIKNEAKTKLPKAAGITVNKVHGSQKSIDKIKEKYNPDIESMEGAAALYTAKIMDLKILQLRAISNRVEPRNKDNWNINLAITELNKELIKIFEQNNH